MAELIALGCVALGAGLGAQVRYGLDIAFTKREPGEHWRATLYANITGSLLIGVMVAVLNHHQLSSDSPAWAQFITAGLAGGLTTFSTFSSQVISRARHSLSGAALLISLHAVFGFGAALAGWWVTWKILGGNAPIL